MDMDGIEKYCKNCKWYKRNIYCKAYPDGIPEKIITGELVHDTPWIQADRPFIFEKKKVKEETPSFDNVVKRRRGRPSKELFFDKK